MQLEQQYRLLYEQFGNEEAHPGLEKLATLLGRSERNMRQRLGLMQAQGWLDWQAGIGRGNHSRLRLLLSPDELALQGLSRLLARGELEQAFASLSASQRQQLMTRLPQFLGADSRERQLRIPIHRQLASLDPLHVSSRLEAHVVRQIFDRLCGFDINTQSLQPALAHHWEATDNARSWRFWLRPSLRFHDDSPLDAHAVAASLLRLRDLPSPSQTQYRGLQHIEVHNALSLSFHLHECDWLWPNRLVTANASIVPLQRAANFAQRPVGSGPFCVQRHSEQRLTLAANKHYYRERPLLDSIDLWVITALDAGQCFDLRLDQPATGADKPLQSACTYLVPNPARPALRDAGQRRQLLRFLSSPALVHDDDPLRYPAKGLLPGWQHPPADGDRYCPLPAGSTLTLTTYDLPSFPPLAAAIQARLASAGVTLTIRTLDYEQFESRNWWPESDLVLSSEVLHDDRDYSCHEWLGSNPVLQAALHGEAAVRMANELLTIQQQADAGCRMTAYRQIGDWLVRDGWLLPLSHERQGVLASTAVAGLKLGLNGWMDFAGLWLRDDA